jgi:hypothetical protein
MNDTSSNRDPVEALAEEFLQRKRCDDNPTVEECCAQHRDLADEIRDLFPALLMMEDFKLLPDGEDEEGDAPPDVRGVSLQEKIGDYRILREVGRGGMGIVYEAEQEQLGRRVALKILTRSLTKDSHSLARFRREARAAARLHHTNIKVSAQPPRCRGWPRRLKRQFDGAWSWACGPAVPATTVASVGTP